MSNNRSYIIIGIVLVLLIAISAILLGGKQWSWRETYDFKKKDPYGAYVLAQLLDNYFPEETLDIRKDSIAEFLESTEGNYFFLGNSMYVNEETAEALQDFVARGNQAFIISQYVPYSITAAIFDTSCLYNVYEDDYGDETF